MFIFIIIFLFSFFISYFLLNYNSLYIFLKNEYQSIFIAAIIYFAPKFFFPFMPLILDIAFAITLLTDIIEYSVFSIIPIFSILYSLILGLYHNQYALIIAKIINSFLLLIIFLLLLYFFKKIFKKEGLGLGDVYFYFILVWYFDLIFLFLSFFFASLIGIGFIILHKIIFFKEPLKKLISFIPCLYLSVSLLQIKIIYNFLYSLIII